MKTLSLIAQKGGTGKTTLGIHLAVQALRDGRSVLLIDTDPQGSAGAWWQRRQAEVPALVQGQGTELPGMQAEARARGFDLVIVDTAPHSSEQSRACAECSDAVLIPTRPAILDLDAIGITTALVAGLSVPAEIVLNACPPPLLGHETRIVAEAREALGAYPVSVCPVAVSQRAAFSHALIDGHAVVEFEAHGKAAAEIDALWRAVKPRLGL
ncbi:ParA family protein [Thiohalocapsa sp. ML1]|uniref:ParA family protein n=1 Tax=Thiohalocapsa sp. ML1 TaxID=1431688 RepID=UPI00073213FB|nr:ParA family protein [Thiohalocapsa sp. ML1]